MIIIIMMCDLLEGRKVLLLLPCQPPSNSLLQMPCGLLRGNSCCCCSRACCL
jgi:hypothetical protein